MVGEPDASKQATGGKQPHKPTKKPRGGFWRWLILYTERKMHQRRSQRKKKRCEEKPQDKAARQTATATKWIAVFTVVLAGVGALTLFELIQGGADTKALVGAAGDQADAAQQFSDTAEDINGRMSDAVDQLGAASSNARAGIKATQEAMRLDQRAWVGVLQVTGVPEKGKVFEIESILTNTGKTPATHMTRFQRSMPILRGRKLVPDYSGAKDGSTVSSSILLPNQWFRGTTHASDKVLDQSDIDLISKRDVTIYLYGKVCYKDVFGRSHWERFCSFYDPDTKSFPACANYNEVDTDKTAQDETCELPPNPN